MPAGIEVDPRLDFPDIVAAARLNPPNMDDYGPEAEEEKTEEARDDNPKNQFWWATNHCSFLLAAEFWAFTLLTEA